MANTTRALLIALSLIAILLVGINIGKKIGGNTGDTGTTVPSERSVTPTITPLPLSPTYTRPPLRVTLSASPSANIKTFTRYVFDSCGVSFSYPSTYIKQRAENEQAVLFADPQDSSNLLAVACAENIPKPPVTSDNIEAITVASQSALLYHDTNTDGSPRDEVIIKNIIIAAPPSLMKAILPSIKFLK